MSPILRRSAEDLENLRKKAATITSLLRDNENDHEDGRVPPHKQHRQSSDERDGGEAVRLVEGDEEGIEPDIGGRSGKHNRGGVGPGEGKSDGQGRRVKQEEDDDGFKGIARERGATFLNPSVWLSDPDHPSSPHNHTHKPSHSHSHTRSLSLSSPHLPTRPHSHPPLPHPRPKSILQASLTLILQSTPSLLISLLGLIFTGELLEHLAVWRVFTKCDELFILVPALQNLKGNLEMCLGARLGTSAAKGLLDTPARRRFILTNSLLFLQFQALTISLLASFLSFLIGYLMKHRVALPDALPGSDEIKTGYTRPGGAELMLILSGGMITASLSSVILGGFMGWLVVGCKWLGLDPDNIASPLAACLGDLLTLFILALVGTALVLVLKTPIPALLLLFMIGVTFVVRWQSNRLRAVGRNVGGRKAQQEEQEQGGWSPLIGAMLISCATGVVLERSVSKYEGFAILAMSMTGIAGSIGAIYASRLSTSLHASVHSQHNPALTHPLHHPTDQSTSRLGDLASGISLFIVAWPVQAFFLTFVGVAGWLSLKAGLLAAFLAVYAITTGFSLIVAHYITFFFWNRNLDPDSYTLPIHSALVDLVGQLMLVAAYEIAGH